MLCNTQDTNKNRPLTWPELGSADKYTTLLLLASVSFSLVNLFIQGNFLLNPYWLATFFEVKKVESNLTFYCF